MSHVCHARHTRTLEFAGLSRSHNIRLLGTRVAQTIVMNHTFPFSALLLLSVACSAGTAPEPGPGGSSSGGQSGDSKQDTPVNTSSSSSSSSSSSGSSAACSLDRFDFAQCGGTNTVGEINGKCVAYVFCSQAIPCAGSQTCTRSSEGKDYCAGALCSPTR
jgi:hypothetical protein